MFHKKTFHLICLSSSLKWLIAEIFKEETQFTSEG